MIISFYHDTLHCHHQPTNTNCLLLSPCYFFLTVPVLSGMALTLICFEAEKG